ncbi:MAG: CopG family antitoxin [bacterium]
MRNNKKTRKLPDFENEDAERDFWAKNNTMDYFKWKNPAVNPVFPNLKPSRKTISIRLPQYLLDNLKSIANKKDIPTNL